MEICYLTSCELLVTACQVASCYNNDPVMATSVASITHSMVARVHNTLKLGECIALWGEPNELSIQYHIYIFIQYVDS